MVVPVADSAKAGRRAWWIEARSTADDDPYQGNGAWRARRRMAQVDLAAGRIVFPRVEGESLEILAWTPGAPIARATGRAARVRLIVDRAPSSRRVASARRRRRDTDRERSGLRFRPPRADRVDRRRRQSAAPIRGCRRGTTIRGRRPGSRRSGEPRRAALAAARRRRRSNPHRHLVASALAHRHGG